MNATTGLIVSWASDSDGGVESPSSVEMRAVYERFHEHSSRTKLAYNYYMAPERFESEVLDDFYSQDTENASEINRQYSSYTLSYPLHHTYMIYGAGA